MSISPDERINILKERMEYVRIKYFETKSKLLEFERKKKRALQRKKDRERKEQRELAKANAAANAMTRSDFNSDSDSSSSKNENSRNSRLSRHRDNGCGSSGRSSTRSDDNGSVNNGDSRGMAQEEAT